MIEQLAALAKIADIDAEALKAETELRDIPARIQALRDNVKKLGDLLTAERQQVADADRLLSAQEEELSNQSQALARSKQKGARARNMRETDAVERDVTMAELAAAEEVFLTSSTRDVHGVHAVDGRHLMALELLDHLDVVGRARALDRAQ